ncbi:GNAT family N-acetyltransferase [Nocardia mangyaensis]|uniref:GNAT family N-acetyltransferase n=1 Tax=Nocardia mangyaensis TaxID=2213200 RepID=UPI001430B87C|nr:GNAT family N-acetyltransferase [Nocardia mangyaensis]MBC7299337.1 GNAT family N-acetyltransferase [Nocardia sp.]
MNDEMRSDGHQRTAPGLPATFESVRLRPLQTADEGEVRPAHQVMDAQDCFTFALDLAPDLSWSDYHTVREEERRGMKLREGIVATTYLVATVDGRIVGRTSIRHTLNEGLRRRGGHIGYGVLPAYRRRGLGTVILQQSVVVARSIGIDRILVTCDDKNIGSRRIFSELASTDCQSSSPC